MARKKRTVKRLPTIWEVDDELWKIIQGILDELDPPAQPAVREPNSEKRSTASSTRCAVAVSGTNFPRSLATTVRFTARCSVGLPRASSSDSGPY